MRKYFGIAVIITGFGGIIAQIVLLRELMVSVYGNELSIGIILANWLILEAVGCSIFGRTIEKVRNKLLAFIILQIIFSLFLPAAIYGARIFKQVIGVTTGEGLGIVPMFLSSFVILLPVSLSHGALFTFSCRIYSTLAPLKRNSPADSASKGAGSIGGVYVYETVGTIAGGIAANFLIQPLNSFQIAFMVGLLNLLMCMVLMRISPSPLPSPPRGEGKRSGRITQAAVLVFMVIFLVFLGNAHKVHDFSIRQQWKGQDIVHYENSIYGNITVAKSAEQYTFYTDGIPAITVPTPDIAFVEEFGHISLLSHPEPEHVLIISSGAGGLINEVLKHGVKKVDYAELDPLLLKVLRKYSTRLTEDELSDPRVNIEHIDGRLFIKSTENRYDVILVGLSNPSDLQINRLFTKEFFKEASEKLAKSGILAITSPGSLTYLSKELGNLNGCILETLRSVYKYVSIVPGDFNLYLASNSAMLLSTDADLMKKRFGERKLRVNLITPQHIDYKLDQSKLNWFKDSIREEAGINSDFLPLGFFYSLSHWNALFSPYMRGLFRVFGKFDLKKFSILFFLLLVVSILFHRRIAKLVFPFAIMSTGFSGMIFQLALIFTFQAVYGYVYYRMALLITTFMAGVAGGSLLITRAMEGFRKERLVFFRMELAIIVFSIVLPLVFLLLSSHPQIQFLLHVLFPILCLISGFLIGMEFPLANRIYLPISKDLSTSAGFLYGSDLIGGWIGGIMAGVVLLPVMGLLGTCLVVTMLKVCSAAIVRRSL